MSQSLAGKLQPVSEKCLSSTGFQGAATAFRERASRTPHTKTLSGPFPECCCPELLKNQWFYLITACAAQQLHDRLILPGLLVMALLSLPFSLLPLLSASNEAGQPQLGLRQPMNPTPSIISTTPTAGETHVSVAQPLLVTFDRAINPSTLNHANIIVQAVAPRERITGTITYENHAMHWTPMQYWRPFATYQITLTAGIQDITGSPLITYTWLFTTHFDSNLPIVVVDTFGKIIQDEPKIPAAMQMIWNPYLNRQALYDLVVKPQTLHFNGRIGIEIRGNTSQAYPKKQYGFETWDADNQDIDASLLALPAESDWILQGPYLDKSLMRNHLAYYLSNQLDRYAVRTHYVELFLNSTGSLTIGAEQYVGVYLLMERIKRNKNRVNVSKLSAEQNVEPEISGGYIIKQDVIDPDDGYFYTAIGNHQITYVYPDSGQITEPQKTWIGNYFNQFETALVSDEFADPAAGYAQFIDVDSFVDHLLLNEFLRNVDAFRISAYLHKDRQGKLIAGPIWDFDFSAGNMDLAGAWNPRGWQVHSPSGGTYRIPFWWLRLLEDNCFVQRLAWRWLALRTGPLQTTTINRFIDNTAHLLHEAQTRNFQRWQILGRKIYLEEFVGETYAEEIDYLKSWLALRSAWMDQNIKSISTRQSPQSPGLCVLPSSPAQLTADGYTTILPFVIRSQPQGDVTIRLRSADHSSIHFSPDTLNFAPSTWETPQPVTITISDTTISVPLPSLTYTVTLDLADSADPGYTVLATTTVTMSTRVLPELNQLLYLPIAVE